MSLLAETLTVRPDWGRNVSQGAICVLAGVCCGAVVTALPPQFGLWLAPGSVFLFLLFAWLCRDPFRVLLYVIMTWPFVWPARLRLPAGIPDVAYERVLVLLAVALVVLPAVVHHRRLPRMGIMACIYVVSMMIILARSLWFGGLVRPEFGNVINFAILPPTIYWLTKNLVVSERHLRWLLAIIVVTASAICCTGIYERVLDLEQSPFNVTPHNEAGDTRYLGVPGGRAAGVLGNPGVFGAVMGFGVLCGLCQVVHSAPHSRTKHLFIAATALTLYGVLICYTRSAWVSVVFALFAVQFCIKDIWKKTLPAFFVGFLLLAVLGALLADHDIIQNRVLEKDNAVGRVDRAFWCWQQFLHKPVMGWGLDSTNYLMPRMFSTVGFETSHNTFFSLMVDGGLLLSLSFVGLLLLWLTRAWSVLRTRPRDCFQRSVAAAMAGFIMIYAMSGMAMELRYYGFFNSLVWIAGATIEVIWASSPSPPIATVQGQT